MHGYIEKVIQSQVFAQQEKEDVFFSRVMETKPQIQIEFLQNYSDNVRLNYISSSLSDLFNKSLNTGGVPSE